MDLSIEYLGLTTEAVKSLVETANTVKVLSNIDKTKFMETFSDDIFRVTLTSEKAIYAAMSVAETPLPTINSLFQ